MPSLYRFHSAVPLDDFKDHISVLQQKPMKIKDKNLSGLSQLFTSEAFTCHRQSPSLSNSV
jgi:hypothetical protein